VREKNSWSEWVAYIIKGIEITAKETIKFVEQIRLLIMDTKQRMRDELPKTHSQELFNNLFFHPYTKVQFLVDQVLLAAILRAVWQKKVGV